MDFHAEEFDRIMSMNVKGVRLGMKHAARVMVPRRNGCIISTSSVASVLGGLGESEAYLYCTSAPANAPRQ